jgi:hypothetical protein
VTADVNVPQQTSEGARAEAAPVSGRTTVIRYGQLAMLIRFLNFVLILAAGLYCMTLLSCLAISLIGRLGGINHIARAFFLSLAFAVLLLPWQRFFGTMAMGAVYTGKELLPYCEAAESTGLIDTILGYLRFVGYWLLVVWILIWAQLRSGRWTRATLRRLEVA